MLPGPPSACGDRLRVEFRVTFRPATQPYDTGYDRVLGGCITHFLKPPGVAADSYDVDNKLAPGSIWRVRIPLGARRKVALWGGDGLKVRSNNPGVVPNEDNDAVRDVGLSGDLRLFELFGRSEGTSLIDVWGADRNFWFSIQARIEPTASTIQFGGPNNSAQESGDAQYEYENNPQGRLVRITAPVKRPAYLNLQ